MSEGPLRKKLSFLDPSNSQTQIVRMQWQSSSTSARKLGRSERGFAFNIAPACPETAGGFAPALTFFAINPCKQSQANSSQMNTCTKRGRGWGHYVTFIFVGAANPRPCLFVVARAFWWHSHSWLCVFRFAEPLYNLYDGRRLRLHIRARLYGGKRVLESWPRSHRKLRLNLPLLELNADWRRTP